MLGFAVIYFAAKVKQDKIQIKKKVRIGLKMLWICPLFRI